MSEAVQSVAVGHDTLAFYFVQNCAYLLRRKFPVIEERNEASNGSLEVDVVLPESIVCVDEKGLRVQLPTPSC
jgi:hypothetical protein